MRFPGRIDLPDGRLLRRKRNPFLREVVLLSQARPVPGLLSEGAEIIETVIADARYTTVAMDGSAKTTVGMTFDSQDRTADSLT